MIKSPKNLEQTPLLIENKTAVTTVVANGKTIPAAKTKGLLSEKLSAEGALGDDIDDGITGIPKGQNALRAIHPDQQVSASRAATTAALMPKMSSGARTPQTTRANTISSQKHQQFIGLVENTGTKVDPAIAKSSKSAAQLAQSLSKSIHQEGMHSTMGTWITMFSQLENAHDLDASKITLGKPERVRIANQMSLVVNRLTEQWKTLLGRQNITHETQLWSALESVNAIILEQLPAAILTDEQTLISYLADQHHIVIPPGVNLRDGLVLLQNSADLSPSKRQLLGALEAKLLAGDLEKATQLSTFSQRLAQANDADVATLRAAGGVTVRAYEACMVTLAASQLSKGMNLSDKQQAQLTHVLSAIIGQDGLSALRDPQLFKRVNSILGDSFLPNTSAQSTITSTVDSSVSTVAAKVHLTSKPQDTPQISVSKQESKRAQKQQQFEAEVKEQLRESENKQLYNKRLALKKEINADAILDEDIENNILNKP